ncbi:phosphate butyryltransferase [Virgibacillus kekensis]|uniref:Phosphate butyryltransferase n=1 Tax=Virgibacillus kekensis TaxID=202261 RepID=A0ABV9DIX1_9BACI
MQTLAELTEKAKHEQKKTVAVAAAADREVLIAVKKAAELNLCSFLLFGNEAEIHKQAGSVGLYLNSDQINVVDAGGDPAGSAVRTVNDKSADILMKGNVPTKTLLAAVLNKEWGLRSGSVLSHVALFEIPAYERVIFLTDAAMNISPGLKEKTEIIKNAVKVAHGIGLGEPKAAVLAAVEVVNESMQATTDAALLTQMQKRGQIGGCIVDGPLAFDNAVSLKAAGQKNITSDVAGMADILVVPNIETGNALYKSFMYFANAKVASVLSGAKAPIVLTSRADSSESKLYSLSLALLSSKTF